MNELIIWQQPEPMEGFRGVNVTASWLFGTRLGIHLRNYS
jgi:hypothetical protein